MPRELLPSAEAEATQPLSSTRNDVHSEGTSSSTQPGKVVNELVARLHPYPQLLGTADIESCILVEEAFPLQERCSREKFEYRFRACSELCLGLFSSNAEEASSASAAQPVETSQPARKAVLLAHIIATRTTGSTISDADMALPDPSNSDPTLGHKDDGRTVCIHSLAVLPAYQRNGLATILLREYLERLRSSSAADAVAIITHDDLIPYYQRFGFVLLGASQAQFGGGGWYDMVLTL